MNMNTAEAAQNEREVAIRVLSSMSDSAIAEVMAKLAERVPARAEYMEWCLVSSRWEHELEEVSRG